MKKIAILLFTATLFQNVMAAEQIDVEVLLGMGSEKLQAHIRDQGYERAEKAWDILCDEIGKLNNEEKKIGFEAQTTEIKLKNDLSLIQSNQRILSEASTAQQKLIASAREKAIENQDLGFSIDIYMENLQLYLDDNNPGDYDRFINRLASKTNMNKSDLLTKKSINTVEWIKAYYAPFEKAKRLTLAHGGRPVAIPALTNQLSQLQTRLMKIKEGREKLQKLIDSYEEFLEIV